MSEDAKKKYIVTDTGQVMNSAGELVTHNPSPANRPWIKLWVSPWLDGTTRWQTTGEQRAFWLDLLAMSARCRFPGYICAGQDAGQIVGYPLKWFAANQSDTFDVLATLQLFERTGKIRIIVTATDPVELFAVEILNWDLYQSPMDDAERARAYRERQAETEKKKKK